MTYPEPPRQPRPQGSQQPPTPPGSPPPGQSPYPQSPYPQFPYPQQPYGQDEYGPHPYGPQPDGTAPYEPQPYRGAPYPAARPRTSVPWLGWVLLGAGALMLVGSVSPWATVHVLGDITVNGTDGDGVLTLIFAIVVAVMGVLIGVGRGRLWTSIVALVFAGFAALTSLVDVRNVSGVYDGDSNVSDDAISIGFGLWFVVIAALAAVAFAIVAMIRRS